MFKTYGIVNRGLNYIQENKSEKYHYHMELSGVFVD